jgi:hypothetical protein
LDYRLPRNSRTDSYPLPGREITFGHSFRWKATKRLPKHLLAFRGKPQVFVTGDRVCPKRATGRFHQLEIEMDELQIIGNRQLGVGLAGCAVIANRFRLRHGHILELGLDDSVEGVAIDSRYRPEMDSHQQHAPPTHTCLLSTRHASGGIGDCQRQVEIETEQGNGIILGMIYTLGYNAFSTEQIRELVEKHGAFLVDVRISALSQRPGFSEQELAAAFPSYVRVRELGNLNYKTGGEIRLLDPRRGAERVGELLSERPVILLCACRKIETCHRRVAAEVVAAATGHPVVHLQPPPPPPPRQTSLW